MPAGRPTEYNDTMPGKVEDYLSLCKDVYDSETKRLTVNIPSIEGLADFLDVNKTTIYLWESNYPIFSNALDKIRARQGKELINKGLSGDYNSKIASMMLSANHGIVEKTQTDLTSKGEKIETASVEKSKAFDEWYKQQLSKK